MSAPIRVERWTLADGSRTAEVMFETHGLGLEVVSVSYELFEQMVTDLGFTRVDDEATS